MPGPAASLPCEQSRTTLIQRIARCSGLGRVPAACSIRHLSRLGRYFDYYFALSTDDASCCQYDCQRENSKVAHASAGMLFPVTGSVGDGPQVP